MPQSSMKHGFVAFAGATLLLTVTAAGVQGPGAATATKFNGTWLLNKDQSTKPEKISTVIPGQNDMKLGTDTFVAAKELVRVMTLVRPKIAITATAAEVKISTEGLEPEVYHPTGKSENLQFGKVLALAETSWSKNAMKIEAHAEPLIVTRTIQVSDDGKKLTMTTRLEGPPGADDFSAVKFVYDHQ